MDYFDQLRPILSLAAHHRASTADADQPEARPVLRRELDRRLGEIRSHHRDSQPGYFTMACVALEEMLDEFLPDDTASAPRSEDISREKCFFSTLDTLLEASGYEKYDQERLQALEVFTICVELGYRGRDGNGGETGNAEEYLRRCREELATATPALSAISAPPMPAVAASVSAWSAMLPFWLIPVVVTVAIFSLFSLILSDLCASALQ